MITSFGGTVTSGISGKTDVLVVGKEPGFSKVSQARGRGIKLMDLSSLSNWAAQGNLLEDANAKPLEITDFSTGYYGNGLAQRISNEAYDFAATGAGGFGSKPKPRKSKRIKHDDQEFR